VDAVCIIKNKHDTHLYGTQTNPSWMYFW